MKIQAASRVYVQWPVAGIPPGSAPMQVRFNSGPWHDLEYVLSGDVPLAVRALVAGPDYIPGVGDIITYIDLTQGTHVVEFRFVDNPEVTITNGGTVDVVAVAPAHAETWGVTVPEVAALIPHIEITAGPVEVTGALYSGPNRAITDADVLHWIRDVSAMVDVRLRTRTALTDPVREVVQNAAHTIVLNGAAEYAVSAAFPMRAGINDMTSYSAELRRRYEEGLAMMGELIDSWLAPGGEPVDPTIPETPGAGGMTGGFPATRFPDAIRW